jgi:hypothetical protein
VGLTTGSRGPVALFAAPLAQNLYIADNPELSLGSDASFTIAARVKLLTKPPRHQGICCKYDSGNTAGAEWLLYLADSDRFQFLVGNGSAFCVVRADTLGSPALGVEYDLRAWHDAATDRLFIQANDERIDEAPWSGGTRNGAGFVTLGALFQSGLYLDGTLGPVSVWKRVLTREEWNVWRVKEYPWG